RKRGVSLKEQKGEIGWRLRFLVVILHEIIFVYLRPPSSIFSVVHPLTISLNPSYFSMREASTCSPSPHAPSLSTTVFRSRSMSSGPTISQ
ncbi:hypothetical protein PMAYCL1PPCAC_19085, partial [Pristionchus mayeri]